MDPTGKNKGKETHLTGLPSKVMSTCCTQNTQKSSSPEADPFAFNGCKTACCLGQQPATQKKQDASQGKTTVEGDPKKAPLYTTASAAWEKGSISSAGIHSSPAMAKGPWGQSRGFYNGAVLGAVKDKHDRPDRGSDVGGIQDGSSDINTGNAISTSLRSLHLQKLPSCCVSVCLTSCTCCDYVMCAALARIRFICESGALPAVIVSCCLAWLGCLGR